MNEYNAMMIARAEHEQMSRSLPRVSEFGENVLSEQPGWVSQQAGRILCTVGNGLTSLGERLEHGRTVLAEATTSTQEQGGVLS